MKAMDLGTLRSYRQLPPTGGFQLSITLVVSYTESVTDRARGTANWEPKMVELAVELAVVVSPVGGNLVTILQT
jgi:hypothetical protein